MNSWKTTWFDLSDTISLRSKCSRRKVGAVIVEPDGKTLVSLGYNGAPRGFPEKFGESCATFCPRACEDTPSSDYSSCVSVHAEVNAILRATRPLDGCSIYVNSAMCWDCAKIVANSGITSVCMVVLESDSHRNPDRVIHFLKKCGLEVFVEPAV